MRVCVCVSLSVISCKNNSPHLQLLGRRVQTKKKERKTPLHIHPTKAATANIQFCAKYIIFNEVLMYLYLNNLLAPITIFINPLPS